jgi:hypothetical protein
MDHRWNIGDPCELSLNKTCIDIYIEEDIFPAVKVVGKTAYIGQLMGNDFFYQDAKFSFDYL